MAPLKNDAKELYKSMRALAGNNVRTQVLSLCKNNLETRKATLQSQFESGELSGIETASRMAKIHDNILRALFAFADKDLYPNPEAAPDFMSLCAVGGYGRGEMAPFSDLDLLFLYSAKSPSARSKEITEYILYILWDLNLKIGHAIRRPEDCIKLAREDETVLSTLLDLRILAGAIEPVTQLVTLLRKERSRAKIRSYISAKLGAREQRHAREGNSRYVIEPNIKEGKGGLRDLHVLYWIARFVYGGKPSDTQGIPVKPHKVSAYMRLGLLDASAGKRFTKAAEFLWQVRHHLHFLVGRATESLSFDRQDALAIRMGYTQDAPEARVEAFMRTYFTTTKEVGALTRIACAKLESQSAILLPQGLDRFLPTSRRGLKEPGFVLDHGRLDFSNIKNLKKNPVLMLKLFYIAGVRNLDIHPNAFASVSQNLSLIDDEFRSDPEAAKTFLDILLKSAPPGAVLQTMNEAGILGTYLPEFGSIVARTQFNMHHAYTVDDHTISLIRYLHDLERGNLQETHPYTTRFLKGFTEGHRLCLYLACLFHDVGKSEGDQCVDGARLSREATRRMGLPDADIDTISWLVRNHLEMSETAQRRDISDPDTIERFAGIVGSVARLQMLTALTVVDIRAVGPGIWNDWKGELMRQLYDSTLSCLMDGTAHIDTDIKNAATENLLASLAADTAEISAPIFRALAPAYWQNVPQDMQLLHVEFFLDASKPLSGTAKFNNFVRTHLNRPKDITELWVLAKDRKNLFSDLAGAIAISGASVTGAQLHTSDDGIVFNIFYLQNSEGLAFGRKTPARLTKLESNTLKALKNGLGGANIPQGSPSRRAKAIPIHPRASFAATGKTSAMLEVTGRDRPGLLYDLGTVLGQHNLSIRSAHVEVLGPKAIDVFYVSHRPEIKIEQERLQADLLAVLSDVKSPQSESK